MPILSVSTDYRGDNVSRIWDERRNAYLTDETGRILEYVLPRDAAMAIMDIQLAAWLS